MKAILTVGRQALSGLLALTVAGPLSAGFLATDRTLANFAFKGSQVDYWPDPRILGLPVARTASPGRAAPDVADPLGGALHLSARPTDDGNLHRGAFNRFGTLPTADSLPHAELLTASAAALTEDSKTGDYDRLLDPVPVAGMAASVYRGAGIFLLPAGLDETPWIQGYRDADAIVRLIEPESSAAPTRALPVPLPGSLPLLAGGLAILILGRRRARG